MHVPGLSARALPRRRTAVVAVAVLVAALTANGPGPASASNNVDHRLAAASDDLAVASKAVVQANHSLLMARTLLPAARVEAASALAALAASRTGYAAARARSQAAVAKVALARARLADAQAHIVATNGAIGDLARAVYTQGPYAEIAVILSASSPSEFADQLEAIRSVSRAQNKTLADLNAAKADLALRGLQAQQALAAAESARAAATAALAGASTAAARATRAQARVRAIIASRAHALAVARHARARVAAQYVELKREQARLRALDRRRGGYQGPVSGELFWPIPGSPIVQGVGPRIHPVYGYKSCHTGDDVKGWYGTPIRAAANGRVIAVLNEGAYGLHTLIAHGGTLSTMYAHQSGVAVHAGQIVQRGQVIGYVGASGWVTGPHLHFEVHVDGVPYDPMGWFGGPKVPVSCWNG